MKTVLCLAIVLLGAACTVNVYDYSTHSGGGQSQGPDTVYVEKPPVPDPELSSGASEPDTLTTRKPLLGGGAVVTEECGNWTRHTLSGCVSETDGVYMELSPSVEVTEDSDGGTLRSHTLAVNCVIQPGMFARERETRLGSGAPSFSGEEVLFRLATQGDPIVFPVDDAGVFHSDWRPDGTVSYTAVFPVNEGECRSICCSDRIVVLSDSPAYSLIFAGDARRLLQQYFDIFVIHNGDAPVLPVQTAPVSVGHRL